jgi:antitoxin FitA
MQIRMTAHAEGSPMPKSVQIRDLDDDVYAALARRAAESGLTVPELLRRHAQRLAARPTIDEWLARTGRRSSDISRDEVLDSLDELRGTWPDAGR